MTSDDLYSRLLKFAKDTYLLSKTIDNTDYTREYFKQLIRSSSSVGANYIEALEAISKKDFIHRLKICRKEARESLHWLTLLEDTTTIYSDFKKILNDLIKEASELVKIFTASILTAERNQKITK